MKRIVMAVLCAVFALLFAASCSNAGGAILSGGGPVTDGEDEVVEIDDGTTDQMFTEEVYGAELYVFQIDGETVTVDGCYSVGVYTEKELVDGRFYKIVADVTYLNGGIAGYVNYPEIQQVTSCKEVSPYDIGLPSTEDAVYGLTLIGDYADGDILFNEWHTMAVWKDGKWVWHYDDEIELDDGRYVGVREGVTEEDVLAGIDNGVLSCKDYFVAPIKSY